jgi:tetratricopeptide (TPR) repeat protein
MRILLIVFIGLLLSGALIAEPSPADYPQSLHLDLQRLRETGALESSDPRVLLTLARLYLAMGDDLWTDSHQRIAAYQEGARFARRALDREDTNAVAHFVYAATTGSAAHLQGLTTSARVVPDLKAHVRRALELQPNHAPSLHMMGRMLDELPWFMGGDAAKALEHLERAVKADPNYAHAHLDLGKAYLKRGLREQARRELRTVVNLERPNEPYAWSRRYRPEAERLLEELLEEGKR